MTQITRRDLVKGLTLGTTFAGFADFARGQEMGADDHYFFFVELRGGLQWMVATDGRDPDKLPLADKKVCRTLKITDEPLSVEDYADIVRSEMYRKAMYNGKFILLPYVGDDPKAAYTKGKTGLGAEYVLGWTANALKPHVDDVAVVRGVYMQADFHGLANASGEIFSGLPNPDGPHVAAVLSAMLAQKHGTKLLDNLVFENATYSPGTVSAAVAKAPVRLDGESLDYIVGNADATGADAAAQRFSKARELADALSRAPQLSDLHRKVFQSYIGAMKEAPTIRRMLLDLKSQLSAVDASLDLSVQLKTGWTLMQAGLTRVVTLCLGAPNGKNKVDGFGLFDAHQGVYHVNPEYIGAENTQRHHLNVEKTMGVLADFVKQLKAAKYGNTGKTWFDVATVVVGTEFARPSNFAGNEASGDATGTAFGNGHYNFNNNFILFGKGVKGGAWLGSNDPVTQMAAKVDMTTAGEADPTAVKMTPFPMNFTPQGEGGTAENGQGMYTPKELDVLSDQRPIMTKDVVKTILATAGLDGRYAEAYLDDKVKNAKTLKSLVR